MPRETSPGLKILWVWTIGTAAVLVTSVVRTRLRDMEKVMNTDEQPTRSDSFLLDSSPESDEVVREDKSQMTETGDSFLSDGAKQHSRHRLCNSIL